MKDFNFADLFCEILSGILAIIISLLILDYSGYLSMKDILANLTIDFSFLTCIIVLGYLVGLIIDSIGLALGELFLDKFIATIPEPTDVERKNYYKNVQENVSTYRNRQWKFYSLYRNIFIISIIGLYFYFMVTWEDFGLKFSIVTSLIIIAILSSVFYSMRTLINLYYRITKSY